MKSYKRLAGFRGDTGFGYLGTKFKVQKLGFFLYV